MAVESFFFWLFKNAFFLCNNAVFTEITLFLPLAESA